MTLMPATAMHISSSPKSKNLRNLLEGLASDSVPDLDVSDITLDSRAVRSGSVFLAVRGLRNHGLEFAPQAIANGAAAIVYEPSDKIAKPQIAENVIVVSVPNLSKLLGAVANRFFDFPSATLGVLAVTGTNGKTTSAYLLAQALTKLGKSAGYAGTLGYGHVDALHASQHTTADCITVHRQLAAMRDAGDRFVGMEVSSHALDQNRIDGVQVQSALFTNLTRDHLDYHGSFASYGAAKEKLFQLPTLQHCIINVGDVFGREIASRINRRGPMLTIYNAADEYRQLGDRHVVAKSIVAVPNGTRIAFDSSWGSNRINSPLIGAFNVENILGVLAVLLGLDVALTDAIDALEHCAPPPGRMETLSAPDKPLVVVDYAHTPDALSKALHTARRHTQGRLVCVFGCGGDRDAGKRPLMGEISEQMADSVVLTDDNPRMENPDAIIADILQGFAKPANAAIERDRAKAIARAIGSAKSGDLVLIAGKGHENYQIIGRNVKNFSDRDVARKCLGLSS